MKTYISVLLACSIFCTTLAQTSIDTIFSSGVLELEATLSYPTGNGPFPVLILVHGSGPNDRNSTAIITGPNLSCIYPNLVGDTIRLFKTLADRLNAEGYAVFRYDKRTYTHGATLNLSTIIIDDFTDDAIAALEFVKTLPNINPQKVALLGHSQGSSIIAQAAYQRTDVSCMVSLAGPYTPIDTLLAEQAYNGTVLCTGDTAQAQIAYNNNLDVFSQVRNNTWPANQPIGGAYPLFWKSWINLSDSIALYYNSSAVPQLFLQGTGDFNVPTSEAGRFSNNLSGAVDVYLLDNLNHFFSTANSSMVSTVMLDTLIQWLNSQIKTSITEVKPSYELVVKQSTDHLIVDLKYTHLAEITGGGIYDLSGRKILNIEYTGKSILQVSLNNVPKGTHLLVIQTSRGVLSKIFCKS